MKEKIILYIITTGLYVIGQNDSVLKKNSNIIINKKYFLTTALEGRLMIRLNYYATEVKLNTKTTPWGYNTDSIMPLKNTVTPFLNFNINRRISRWLFSIGSKIGEVLYGNISVHDYGIGSTKTIETGEYILNINSGIGYKLNLNKNFLYSKINLEYKLLNIWINEYAAYVNNFKGFSTFYNPAYITSEIMLGIPLNSKHFIMSKIELFLVNIEKKANLFEYKGKHYYYINFGIGYGF